MSPSFFIEIIFCLKRIINNMAEKDAKSLSDEQIVELVLQNEDNFLYLMERYEKKLFWYTKKLSNIPNEDIEDIIQTVFIKVYRNLNSFDQSLKFSSWIYRIMHNEVISFYRKNKKIINSTVDFEIEETVLDNIIYDHDIEREIDQKKLQKNILQALAKLDFKYREVIILKYLEEKSYEEIADILKKPVNTIGTLINRAKKQLFKIIDKNNI